MHWLQQTMKTITLATAPTFFTAVREKNVNHCFFACVVSALLDEGYDRLQDLIVDGLPSGSGKGSPDRSGVPKELTDGEAVLRGSVRWPARQHCVRLLEMRDDGVTIMEPNDGNFHPWTWAEFENEYRALVLLRWQ